MALYARIWRVIACVIGLGAGILALLTEPTAPLLGALAASTAIALSLGLGMSIGAGKQDPPLRFKPVFLGSFAVVAVLALFAVRAYELVAAVVVIAGTSPPVLARVLGTSGSTQRPDGELSAMSTAELAIAWRRTHRELVVASNPAMKARVVLVRAALLDELERRDRDGIQCWFESGGSVEGDPTQYMQRGHDEGSQAA